MADFRSWLELAALALSPLIAVLVSIWIQNRQEKRRFKFGVLYALVANRYALFADERLKALNAIDLIFRDDLAVRKLYKEYLELLSNQGMENKQGYKTRDNKLSELIGAMARTLGYAGKFSEFDFQRAYVPKYFENVAKQNQKSAAAIDLLTEVLTAVKPFLPHQSSTPEVNAPSDATQPPPQR